MNFPDIPQFKVAQSGAAVLKVVLFSVLALALVWFFFIRPEAAQQEAAESRVEATMAEGQAKAAEETVRIIVDHQDTIETITTRTETSSNEILNAPGADQTVDPAVHAAGLRALCLHDNRSNAECGPVLHSDDGQLGPDRGHPSRPAATVSDGRSMD